MDRQVEQDGQAYRACRSATHNRPHHAQGHKEAAVMLTVVVLLLKLLAAINSVVTSRAFGTQERVAVTVQLGETQMRYIF
jgi:hypothetical protein